MFQKHYPLVIHNVNSHKHATYHGHGKRDHDHDRRDTHVGVPGAIVIVVRCHILPMHICVEQDCLWSEPHSQRPTRQDRKSRHCQLDELCEERFVCA